MASDLASQLRSLAAKAGVPPTRLKGQPSLLYDSKTASDIGVDEIYDGACQGASYRLCMLSLRQFRMPGDSPWGPTSCCLDHHVHEYDGLHQFDVSM